MTDLYIEIKCTKCDEVMQNTAESEGILWYDCPICGQVVEVIPGVGSKED